VPSNADALEAYLKDDLPLAPQRQNKVLGSYREPLSIGEISNLAAQGLWRGIKNVGSEIAKFPGDIFSAIQHPLDALKGGAYTAGQAGKKIGAGETYLANLVGDFALPPEFKGLAKFKQPQQDALEDLPVGANPRAFRGGSAAALLAAPAVGEGLLGAALTGAGAGALLAPEGETIKNTLGDALTGALLHGVSKVPSGINAAIARTARGRTPKDVVYQRELSLPDDASVSIGDLTGNPTFQWLYHDVIGGVPGSGVEGARHDLVEAIRDKSANLIKILSHGHSDAAIGQSIADDVRDLYDRLNNESRAHFEAIGSKAAENNVTMPSTNTKLQQRANELITQLNRTPKEYLPSVDAEFANDLLRLSGGKNKFNKELSVRIGGDVVPMQEWLKKQIQEQSPEDMIESNYDYTVPNAVQSRSALLTKARDKAGKLKDYESKMYNDLADAQLEDIEDAVSNAGVPELADDLRGALEFHRKKLVPLKGNKTIRNMVNGKYNDKNIHTTLSHKDYEAVLEQLPQSTKDKILYMHLEPRLFKDEMDNIKANPQGIVNKYENIDDATKSRISRPEVEQDIKQLKSLGKVAEEPLKQNQRAFTGGRNTKTAIAALYGLDLLSKFHQGDYLGLALHGIGIPLLAKFGGKYLTSQRLKDLASGYAMPGRPLFNASRLIKASEAQEPLMNINVVPKNQNQQQSNVDELAKYLGYQ